MTASGLARSLEPDVDVAIRAFRENPDHKKWDTTEDIGGCWNSANAFALILWREGVPYIFRCYKGLPGWRTQFQHVLEVDGLIIDWTARQFRPGCEWPHVMNVDEFEKDFGAPLPCCPDCGSSRGPLQVRGKRIKAAPFREHRCNGPKADPTEDLRPLMERLYQRLSPAERANVEHQLRAGGPGVA